MINKKEVAPEGSVQKQLNNDILDIKRRVATLEVQVQAQPTIEEITRTIYENLKANLPL
jgi:hypothetical protein